MKLSARSLSVPAKFRDAVLKEHPQVTLHASELEGKPVLVFRVLGRKRLTPAAAAIAVKKLQARSKLKKPIGALQPRLVAIKSKTCFPVTGKVFLGGSSRGIAVLREAAKPKNVEAVIALLAACYKPPVKRRVPSFLY